MSLLDFVKLPQVQDKFKVEFKPIFEDKKRPYRKSRNGDLIRKENIGLHFEVLEDKVKLICDSSGRMKPIDSIEDLIGFLTLKKYAKNLCWFYIDSFNFEPILKHLPKRQLEDLEKFGKTQYYAHTIEFSDNTWFKVGITDHGFKFYNLRPHFNLNIEDAAKKFLNYQPTNSPNQSIENANLIKQLANYHMEGDTKNNLAFKEIVNIPLTKNSSTVGTAFDYLLRFLIIAHNPTAIPRLWVAYNSLYLLEDEEEMKEAESIINEAEERYYLFLKDKKMNDDLITSTLLLAKLDVVQRREKSLAEIDMNVDPGDIVDLRNLIQGVPKEMYLEKKICILNPTFGLAGELVRGGDADLLIDNTLVEIKTTVSPKFTSLFFNQLMGYILLHYLGLIYNNNIKEIDATGKYEEEGTETPDKKFLETKIEKIGVYFSRFNYLFTIDLKDILHDGKMNWSLLEWFENEAHKVYQPIRIKKFFNKSVRRKLKFGHITLDELLYPNRF